MFNRQLPAVTLEPEDFKQAHRDLAKHGLTGSMLYAAIWGVGVLFTPVVEDWPVLTWGGLIALAVIGGIRMTLGLLFEPLYLVWGARAWASVYYLIVLLQVGTWSALYTFVIWHYHVTWPTMLLSFASAGIVAGGIITLSTHPPLQRSYVLLALVPGMLTFWVLGEHHATIMGLLLLAKTVFLLSIGHNLDYSYWSNVRSTRLLKRRAAELEAARKTAESADRAKSQFVAKVSHELRTPLNGLISTIDMLAQANDPEKRAMYLDIMSKSADLLLQRINEILDFSRLQAGKLELESLPMDPAQPVRDAVLLMQDAATAKGLLLETRIDDTSGVWVLGDSMRTTQVLLNFLSNAIKFTQHGTIVVELEQNKGPYSSVHCRYAVRDSGIGIAAEAKKRIFKSFEQADGSTTRQYGGSGLGLAVSQDLVRKMGSSIDVESTPGEGSQFAFTVALPSTPIPRPEPAPVRKRSPGTVAARELRVLVAEDNPVNQFVVKAIMEVLNCTCTIVADGKACVDQFTSDQFDVVFMDCEMPGMDGYEATRRIRAHEQTHGINEVPIIALTAHADDDNRVRTRQVGMSDFVTKPFTLEQISDALHRNLGLSSETAPLDQRLH